MKIDEEDIIKVLALFDKEDIPYINFDYLVNNNIMDSNMGRKHNCNVKVKKLGGKNDRSRK